MKRQPNRRLPWIIFLLTCLCLAGTLSFPSIHARAFALPTAAHDNTVELAGLFSDQGALFDNQLEPTCSTPVVVSIRAYHNDLTSANLIYYDTSTSSSFTVPLSISGQDATGIYDLWQGTIPASCSVKYYRFELIDGSATAWYNAAGASSTEPSIDDFYILPGFTVPSWARSGVMYQIMPDRFYDGDTSNDVTTGEYSYQGYSTIQQSWGASPLVSSNGNQNNLVFYGGDLEGIDQKISYLKNTLGINVVSLMPIFTAPSNHKYDTQDYSNVDPHLGGNSALQQLVSAIHSNSNGASGHVVLDGVFDHTGVSNTWFTQAQASQSSQYYPYYDFQNWPNTYTDFLGYNTLPKLDYGSSGSAARNAIYNSPTSVAQSWIRNYGIDGWRLDAAQYLDAGGNSGSDATNHQIWQEFRTAVKGADPNAFIYGEDFNNAAAWTSSTTPQWDAAMNYAGFTDPVSEWITGEDYNDNASSLTPTQFDAQLQSSRATYPTDVQDAMSNFLSSQDITRFGQRANGNVGEEAEAAIFQMTYEGLPTIFYGDEYGMQGGADPDNRRTFDWSQATTSNSLVALYQQLISIRKTYSSLTDGSFITMLTDNTNNVYAYGRMDQNNTLAVVLNNSSTSKTITLPAYELSMVDGTNLTDLLSGTTYQVSGGQVTLTLAAHSGAVLLKQAGNSVTPTPASTPTPTATPASGTLVTAIDAGGSATGSFVADTDFNQGNEFSDTSTSISTSKVSNPATQAVWQTCRWNSSFAYTIPGLNAGNTYTLDLDWAELSWQAAGKREFNVAINGTTVLSNFDVYAQAGYKTALQKQFSVVANSSGQIVISFTQGAADNPFISGIEIYQPSGSATPTPTPTNTPTPTPTNTPTPTPTNTPTPTPTNTPTPTPTNTPTPTATPASGTLVTAIDAGGSATGSFVADTDFTQGNEFSDTSTSISTSKVSNPAPQAVWQTCRWNSSFAYTIPGLNAGNTYTLDLDWAELSWQAAGQREFNVAINGTTVLSNFDVYAQAGYKTALQKQFSVVANSSGQIVISFTQGAADNPFISGIEIYQPSGSTTPTPTPTNTPTPTPTPTNTPTPTPTATPSSSHLVTAIDAGGSATGSFVADTDFNQGNEFSDTSTSISTSKVSNPAPQAVWQTCRWNSSFAYTLTGLTAGATYTLDLDWAELTWQAAGQREFNVAINGSQVLTNFDVYATAGYKTALQKQFTVTANSSGQIVIAFTQGATDNPFISGIELYTT
jgi:alpha-glucosidase